MNIQNQQDRVKWAILAVFQNPLKKLVPSKYFLYEGINKIGSDQSQSEVVLDVEGISSLHAEIIISSEGDAYIEDSGSKQGIFKKASFNSQKRVKLERNIRYSIIPDHEFYLGKYKCFVVTFDEDYKKGEERRMKEKQKLEQKKKEEDQASQASQKKNYTELSETDLDEEIIHQEEVAEEKQIDKIQEYEKTLEIEERDGEDEEANNLFKQGTTHQQGEEIEKTLEIQSEGEQENMNDLFNTEQQKQGASKESDFEKTLEIQSDHEENGEQLFEANESKSKYQGEVEKTLELSSDDENENTNLFEKGELNKNENNFEKTLELSDRESEGENIFKCLNDEKTLELSDPESEDGNQLFEQNNEAPQEKQAHQKSNEGTKSQIKQLYGHTKKRSDDIHNEIIESTPEIEENINKSLTPSPPQKQNYLLKRQSGVKNNQVSNSLLIQQEINQESQPLQIILHNEGNNRGEMIVEQNEAPLQQIQIEGSDFYKNNDLPATLIDESDGNEEQFPTSPQQNSGSKQNAQLNALSGVNQKGNDKSPHQEQEMCATLLDSPQSSQSNALCSTLVDSLSQSFMKTSSKGKGKKPQTLSPTLYDDEGSNQSQKAPKRRSPISLSPTFLDEEVSVSLLSGSQKARGSQQTQSQKNKSQLQNPILEATIVSSPSSEKSAQLSQGKKQKPEEEELCGTLVDSPMSEERSVCNESKNNNLTEQEILRRKIEEQENELKKLKEMLMKQPKESSQNSNYVINVISDNHKSNQIQQLKPKEKQEAHPQQQQYHHQKDPIQKPLNNIINKQHEQKPRNSDLIEQQQFQQQQQQQQKQQQLQQQQLQQQQQQKQNMMNQKQKTNINFEQLEDFDDLFGKDDEYEKHNSKGVEDQKSRNLREDSNSVENDLVVKKEGQKNFGGLFKQKFFVRTLTMSDNKKLQISPENSIMASNSNNINNQGSLSSENSISFNNNPNNNKKVLFACNEESSEDQIQNKLKLNRSLSLKESQNKRNSHSNNSDDDLIEKVPAQSYAATFQESARHNSNNESDSGEETKKKLKVNSNWGLLKAVTKSSQSLKLIDENSKGSKEESESSQNKKRKKPTQKSPQMKENIVDKSVDSNFENNGGEDDDGENQFEGIKNNACLKVAVSGFKLRNDQKKILKAINCSLVDESEEFDILIVSEVKRTIKLLLALMKKIPIVTEAWLDDCSKRNQLLIEDLQNYSPSGDLLKQRFGEDLSQLLKRRRSIGQENLIFEGLTMYLSKSLTDPSDKEIELLIEAGGGSIRKTLPNKSMKKDSKVIVVLSKQDKQLFKVCNKLKNIVCVTSEAILKAAQISEYDPEDENIISSLDFFTDL